MKREFGAATWIPQGASYYSSILRLSEQWKHIRTSAAIRRLAELPLVQMAVMHVMRHPATVQFQRLRRSNPLVKAVTDLGLEAISREIFLYGDGRWVEFIDALRQIFTDSTLAGIRATLDVSLQGGGLGGLRKRRDTERMIAMLSSLLKHRQALRMPPVVLGFRVAKPLTASETLALLARELSRLMPLPIVQRSAGGGSYFIVSLDASLLPPGALSGFARNLLREGLSRELTGKFLAFVESQTLTISIGVRGNYLLVSVASDAEHLEHFGKKPSLAASLAMAPVRGHFKPGMTSLLYVDEELYLPAKVAVDEVTTALRNLLESLPTGKLPPDLPTRLSGDFTSVLNEFNQLCPEPIPMVAASFMNEGIETYCFYAHASGAWDSSQPLSILARAGMAPLFAFAWRSSPLESGYDRLARWARVAYGYFEDYVVPQLPPEGLREFKHFETVFVSTVKDFHAATRDYLIPALEGCQGLCVADSAGALGALPGDSTRLPRPLRFPRPALVVEVNDAGKLKEAFSRYRRAINGLLKRQAVSNPGLQSMQIPEPQSRSFAGGMLYTYPVPSELRRALRIEPHALVTSECVVLSLFPSQSRTLATSSTSTSRSFEVVDLKAPSGVACRINLEQLGQLIVHDAKVALHVSADRGAMRPEAAQMIEMHLPAVQRALGIVKSFRSRSYRAKEMWVRHSWLRMKDLMDG